MSIYAFEPGPTYRPLTPQAAWDSALSQPLSLGANLYQQGIAGALESYGLGTTLRDTLIPQGNVERTPGQIFDALIPGVGATKEVVRGTVQNFINPDQPSLSEDEYKASAWYRPNIPYDPGMTAARAEALAAWDDARKVREHFASKRPFSSFVGNLGGQALDPINYVPVFGEAVKAASVARFGKVAGSALVASGDAAANTALAATTTFDQRASFGDEVTWQQTISEIATAALIGSVFGAAGGALGARSDARAVREATDRLSTLRTTQEARIALNEGIDAIVRGEDVHLSPNSTEPMGRVADEIVAYHGSPHSFDQFSMDKIGTGEGSQAFGYGLYFAENESVARSYQDGLKSVGQPQPVDIASKVLTTGGEEAATKRLRQFFPDMTDTEIKQAIHDAKNLPSGQIYEVGIKANADEFLDWDKSIGEQTDSVKSALAKVFRSEEDIPVKLAYYRLAGELSGKKSLQSPQASAALRDAGIAGIKYLDNGSRNAGDGTRNYVVFDDKNVRIRSRNGQPIDTSPARPEPIPEGRQQAETRLAKTDDYKALATQYGVDPEKGSFVEHAEIKRLDTEGRLTEQDKADLEAAAQIHENGIAYGDALKAVVGCLL